MTEPGPPLSLRLLGLYPKKAGSAAVGVAARTRLPRALREPLLGRFAASYGIDLSEAEKPLGEYVSFLDFFTRRLKPGLRPQDPAVPGGLNSPVDGALIASGRVEDGTLIQAKGLPYRLDELLAADPLASRFEGGAYATLYLSPRDYHRIHVPCAGRVLAVGRVEGELWPVNEASTAFTRGPLRQEPEGVLDRGRDGGGRGARRGGRHGRRDARRGRRRRSAMARGATPRATRPPRRLRAPVRARRRPRHLRARLDGRPPRRRSEGERVRLEPSARPDPRGAAAGGLRP